MMNRFIRLPFVVVLCCSLLLAQTAPAFVQEEIRNVRVAFLGMKFDDVNPGLQKKILTDLQTILQEEKTLDVITPESMSELIGQERVSALLGGMRRDSLLALAAELNCEYVFAGTFANTSRDPNRTVLIGTFNRFDRPTRNSYSIEILRVARDSHEINEFHEDLKKIKQEFILTILPKESSTSSFWPMVIVGGIALVGLLVLLFSVGKNSGEEPTPNEPVTQ